MSIAPGFKPGEKERRKNRPRAYIIQSSNLVSDGMAQNFNI